MQIPQILNPKFEIFTYFYAIICLYLMLIKYYSVAVHR